MVASSFPSADSFSTSLSIVICDSAPARSGFESLSASCSSFPAVPSETACSICPYVSAWNFSRLADASTSVAASRLRLSSKPFGSESAAEVVGSGGSAAAGMPPKHATASASNAAQKALQILRFVDINMSPPCSDPLTVCRWVCVTTLIIEKRETR